MKNYKMLLFFVFFISSHCIKSFAISAEVNSEEIYDLVAGNSLKITNKFSSSIIYFEPNGLFNHFSSEGKASSGSWRATNDSVCATVLPKANNPPKEFCLKLKGRKFGETWVESYENNGEIKRTLLEGHPTL